MSIIRSPRPTSNFVIISKRLSECKTLSWAARGLMLYLLGKPDNWKISVQHLMKEATGWGTGRDAIYSMIDELIQQRYIKREKVQGGYVYTVFDTPFQDTENHDTPFQDAGFQDTETPTQTSNDLKQVFTGTNKKNNASAGEEDGQQAEQKRIEELTTPYQPQKGDFLIDFDWQPTQAFKTECMRAGKDASAVTKDMLGQFINHYRTKGYLNDQRAYEGLLLSWLMRELAKPKQPASTVRTYRGQYQDPVLNDPDAKMQPVHIMGQDDESVKNRVKPEDFKNKMANLKNLLEQ